MFPTRALAGAVRAILVLPLLIAGACSTSVPDPYATLMEPATGARRQLAAMAVLDEHPGDEEYIRALQRAVWLPGYTVEVREAAVVRLERSDLPGLKRTLRQQLPRMTAWEGLTRLCEIIADRGWVDLTPALVSSWARPTVYVRTEEERPEARALARLHPGEDLATVVFDLLVTSRKVSEQGLRTRCWELLERLGRRDELVALLLEREVPVDDLFMVDLKAGAEAFGVVPTNREEILWMRKLRDPSRADFYRDAEQAVRELPAARRASMEMRDLSVVVAAYRHLPALLAESDTALYDSLDERLRGQRHYSHGGNFDNVNARRRERLYEWRDELTWGDLLAMRIVLDALAVPQVVAHLFDYARRDQDDKTTEYGGVITLDDRGRYEVLEFVPRVREHDERFNASQEMIDAGYTSLAHFHFHAQRDRNEAYAGPGYGDLNYADNLRANCLVLTFVSEDRMNVDFYRHGRMVVDLGVIER